jgi:hypothetical protein
MITLHPSTIRIKGVEVMELAAAGFYKRGVPCTISSNPRKGDVVGVWGWRKGAEYKYRGHEVLVFERGYLGDRLSEWTSIGWNGLNGRADFCLEGSITMDRFNSYFELKPWKSDGNKIIIMGQIIGDMSLDGMNLTHFYNDVYRKLKCHNKEILFRPHPHANNGRRNFKPNIPHSKGTLEEDLSDAYMVVTYNSNSAVDAVLNGIPALSYDMGSMAYNVTGHSHNARVTPQREAWAAKLAYCQWHGAEIENGDFLQFIIKKLHEINNHGKIAP